MVHGQSQPVQIYLLCNMKWTKLRAFPDASPMLYAFENEHVVFVVFKICKNCIFLVILTCLPLLIFWRINAITNNFKLAGNVSQVLRMKQVLFQIPTNTYLIKIWGVFTRHIYTVCLLCLERKALAEVHKPILKTIFTFHICPYNRFENYISNTDVYSMLLCLWIWLSWLYTVSYHILTFFIHDSEFWVSWH